MSQQPFKLCPSCRKPTHLNEAMCTGCGHRYRTIFPPIDQTQVVVPPPHNYSPDQQTNPSNFGNWNKLQFPVGHGQILSPPNMQLIWTMWALTILNFFISITMGTSGMSIALLSDLGAVIIAIFLTTSKQQTDKINGWIKIALEFCAFLIGISAHRF